MCFLCRDANVLRSVTRVNQLKDLGESVPSSQIHLVIFAVDIGSVNWVMLLGFCLLSDWSIWNLLHEKHLSRLLCFDSINFLARWIKFGHCGPYHFLATLDIFYRKEIEDNILFGLSMTSSGCSCPSYLVIRVDIGLEHYEIWYFLIPKNQTIYFGKNHHVLVF